MKNVELIARAISFQDFQPMWYWSTNVTDRQTDRRHAIARPRYVGPSGDYGKAAREIWSRSAKNCSRFWGTKNRNESRIYAL